MSRRDEFDRLYAIFKPYTRMRFVGLLLLVSGWGLVMAALGMLPAAGPRNAFVLAGMAVEILGLVLTVRAHLPRKHDRIPRGMAGEDRLGNMR